MSIYTITLKRELLSGSNRAPNVVGHPNNKQSNKFKGEEEGKEDDDDSSERLIAFEGRGENRSNRSSSTSKQLSHRRIDDEEVYGYNRREIEKSSYWATRDKIEEIDQLLDCVCSKKVVKIGGGDDDEKKANFEDFKEDNDDDDKENRRVVYEQDKTDRRRKKSSTKVVVVGHSNECLKYREKQRELLLERERVLQEQANQIEHSVNVTLEVTANLKQPNRIVWYKNNKQLTSSEKPVLLVSRKGSSSSSSVNRVNNQLESRPKKAVIKATTTTTTTKTTTTKRSSTSAQGEQIEDQEREEEREIKEEINDSSCDLIAKCEQESDEKGSKLKIYDIQDEDYGQYTCKLIDLIDGRQFDIHAQLKEDLTTSEKERTNKKLKNYSLKFQTNAMDEVIEVKEGDLNIELGIQILPETNEDEELMSEEEKADFIENTTITWFKDDVKLDKTDSEIKKLFQFTYDQEAGFHRLIVLKATKETEGVYTCLVENESGTSSCSTQLVVGPGNKPKLTSRLQDVTVYVGQSLEFRIKSTGLPPIDSCQWFKDDKLIIELKNDSIIDNKVISSENERISMFKDIEQKHSFVKEEEKIIIFKLCIDNLKLDDFGRYKCRINNEYGYDETDCMVKVLQEIIEEHEEIEETIEETTRLGGGKKSTQREEQEEIVEEEEEQQVDKQEEEETRYKRAKQEHDEDMLDSDGLAPVFKRKLSKEIFVNEEQIDEEELIVSTEINKWTDSSDLLKIKWFINDVEIIKNTQRDLYEIENFYNRESSQWMHKLILRSIKKLTSNTKSNKNKFTCKASNDYGQDETSCFVESLKKPRFLRKLEDIETFVGETKVIKVIVDIETTTVDDVIFIKDGKVLYSSQSNGEQAQVIGGDNTNNSKSKLKLRTYEEIVEDEEEIEEISRYSRYSSRRSSRQLSAGKRGKVFEITIENVQIDQQGSWECIAKNRIGSQSCKADIEVFAEPKIVTDLPESIRIERGKEIQLTVEASGSPIPVYSWFKDNIGIAEEEDRVFTETKQTTNTKSSSTTTSSTTTTKRRTSVTSIRTEDGISISGETLIIKDARPEDAGVYNCKIENRLGQVKSRNCKITVIGYGDDQSSAPKIIKDFSRDQIFEVEEGENVTLKVLAEGHPKPKQYWFKDTEEIIERITTKYEIENEGQEYELKIKRSQQSDSGNYKVILRNDFGETESRTVQIKVNKVSDDSDTQRRRPSAPTIILDSQDKVVGLGSNISFDVQVGGHPKPFITWYKNGRRLTESGDERICFVEEETITTTTVIEEEEEEELSGNKAQKTRKDVSTIHKLIIKDVRESDEAIYSLKAENDLGSTKSSLVSLTVDKRKETIDELIEESKKSTKSKESSAGGEVVEETTTTKTTTVTTTTEEQEEDQEEDEFRKSRKSSTTRTIEEGDFDEGDEDGQGGKKKTKTRTTRTTTKTTTTTTEEEEEEEEEAARRRRKAAESQSETAADSESDSTRKSKRRTIVEEEEEAEEEEEEEAEAKKVKRRTRVDEEREDVVEEEEVKKRDKTVEMEVEEEEEIREETSKTKKRDSISEKEKRKEKTTTTATSKLEKGKLIEEILEKTETSETTTVERMGPKLISAPKQVVAGLGSSPELEVIIEERKRVRKDDQEEEVVEEEEEEDETKITWLKDDQPIPARLLKDNHIEIIEEVGSKPNTKKHVLRINSLRSSDAASYKLRAENPKGPAVETEPIEVSVDRTMRPGEKAVVTPAEIKPQAGPSAPKIVSIPEEIVAGVGSSPEIVAQIKGEPKPETTWFKDGQPIEEKDLKSGHLEVIERPTEEPDITEQALKINNLKPADVAAYHVKAENPLGEVESEPTNVRIDRSMGPKDEPIVTGETPMEVDDQPSSTKKPELPSKQQTLKAPLGSSPDIEIPVKGGKPDTVEWLKDGKPLTEKPGQIKFDEAPDGTQKLHLDNIKPSDAGEYTLRATNDAGTTESAPVKLVPEDAGPMFAPQILNATEEVVAGPGSQPELQVVIKANPEAAVTWFKDGAPLTERQLADGHLEPVEEKQDTPNVIAYTLKIDKLRASDSATYHLVAKNPLGTTECKPISLKLDRTMRPSETPQVKTVEQQKPDEASDVGDQIAPELLALPEEIVAAAGSSPTIEAQIKASPAADVKWFKDGQPISARELRDGHLEMTAEPTGVPGVTKHALKINNLKPVDVAAYHIKAENPLGDMESEPTNVRIDRSMGPNDEPQITPNKSLPGIESPTGVSNNKAKSIVPTHIPEVEMADVLAPKLVAAAQEVVAGLGSSPTLAVEVAAKPEAEVQWLKDGQPIPARLLRDGHIELSEDSTPIDGVKKHSIKINQARPSDAAEYSLKAENPAGEAESEPIKLKLDRSMSSSDEPEVKPSRKESLSKVDSDRKEPTIVSVPEEIVAGPGSSPAIVAEVAGNPKPEITWFKDGQPIEKPQLRDGHLEIVDMPTDKPDVTKQALKINNLKPADVAAYHVKAENPLGDVESEPTNVRIDRSMGPKDEPIVTGETPMEVDDQPSSTKKPELPSKQQTLKAPLGSSPDIEIPVKGGKPDTVEWLKDGKPLTEKPGQIKFDEAPDGTQKLHLDNIKPSDAGEYTLRATNDAGTTESAPVKLVPEDAGPMFAPQILNATEEVVAGPGSQPELQVVIKANPEAAVTWFKDGAPLTERQLADGHLEPVEEKQDTPNVIAYTLKIDKLRASDSATYHLVAKNPLGTTECKPISLKLDRTMRPSETPQVKSIDLQKPEVLSDQVAPELLSMPEEIVAAAGSSPVIEAQIKASPAADVKWFKDGQPISARELRDGHLEMTAEPTSVPGVTKHALKINGLKPVDVAAYHVKAENPLGDVESEPTNVRIDRSMSSSDEPQVTPNKSLPGVDSLESPMGVPGDTAKSTIPTHIPEAEMADLLAPKLVAAAQEVVAGLGSSPTLAVEVAAKPEAEVQWLKDGQPIPARLLRDGHIELSEDSTPVDGVKKHSLKVNEARPSDAAEYSLKAENPAGEAESEPIKLKLDRSMSFSDEPKVKPSPRQSLSAPSGDQTAPTIVSMPEEIVAGPGSSPAIVAEIGGNPKPEITWFKDGQPIEARQLRDGHLEVVEIPTDKADVTKQALKINNLKPVDVAAYHVRAENPLGDVESEPTNLRIDRSMGPNDEPQVTPVGVSGDTAKSTVPTHIPEVEMADLLAPKLVAAAQEVVAGLGSSPTLAVEVAAKPEAEVQWLKDGQPIPARLIRDGHIVLSEDSTPVDGVKKHSLKVNEARPSDAAEYSLKAENPAGEAESEPIKLKLDRSMSSSDEPKVKGSPRQSLSAPSGIQAAPTMVSMPEEVVAGPGSNPAIVAEVAGNPKPEITWFKDGQPIEKPQLRDGHLEIVDMPTDKPDVTKQALIINNLKPADVAAYHVKAENPLGEVVSEPTNVRIDRSMGPKDEPVVSKPEEEDTQDEDKPKKSATAKPKLPQIARNIKSPLGSSPVLDVEVSGGEPTKVEWLKDGRVLKETPNMHVEFEDLPDGTHKLHINNMKPDDEGVYTLRASNDAGTAESGPITLSVERRQSKAAMPDIDMASEEFAPEIVNLTEEVVAGPGSEPQLEVDIKASPKAEITWFKDGKPTDRELSTGHIEISEQKSPYTPNVTKHILKVDKLKPTDAAIYHVVAKNPLGMTQSKPISLKLDRSLSSDDAPRVSLMEATPDSRSELTEFAPQILSHPDEVVAAVGSSPKLEVVVKSKPVPEISWFKDGQPLTKDELSNGHYEVVREAGPDADTTKESLVIKDLKPADVAAYHVKAENPLGEIESEPTNLRIDRSMAPDSEPVVTKTETPFSLDDALDSAKQRKLVAPSINRMPRKIVAALGSNPVIEVEVLGEPKPEIVWFKDGHQITEAMGHIALVEMPANTHKLCITNLKAVDQGDYTIKAINEAGEVQSLPIALVIDTTMKPRDQPKVIDSEAPEELDSDSTQAKLPAGAFAPRIVRVSDKVTGSLGETARVEVEVKALPAAGITWYNDGSPIPSRSIEEGHVVLSETKIDDDTIKYTLELTSLKPSDAGTYQLEAENPLGSVKSPAVGVTLKDKTPELKTDSRRPSRALRAPKIKRVPRQVVAAVGTSPVLEVEVSGEPIPEIVWFRNGKRIEKTDAHFSFEEIPEKNLYKMIVNDVQLVDEGVYTVQATNEAGTDESGPIELKVEAKQQPTSRRGSKQPRGSISKVGFAPQVVKITEEVVSGVGSSPELEITIKASPKAQVEWFKDGQPLSVADKKKVEISEIKIDSETTKYVLKIKDLKPVDVAAYHVRAENQYGSIETAPINVRIDRSMDSDEAPISSNVEIPFDDSEAVVSDEAPTAAKRRLRAPVIKRMPRKIVAALGSNPVIEIEVSGEPKPEVIWYKNGKRVTEVRNRIEIVEADADGKYKLCFYDLKFTDQAEYTIVAKNEAGSVESSPITLIVDKTMSKHDKPFVQDETDLPLDTTMTADGRPTEAPVILRLEDQEALPGQTIKLEAQVLGVPKPEIKWLKDGDEVELNILNTSPDSDVHSLTLKNVNDLYDGVYSLEASNIAGTAKKEARVKVVDQLTPKPGRVEDRFKPKQSDEVVPKRKEPEERQEKPFIKKGLKFSQVNQGRSIKFEVQVDGKYDELIWMKDGEQINLPIGPESLGDDAMDTDDLDVSVGLDVDNDDDDASTLKGSDDELTTGDDLVSGKPKRRFPPRILMRPRNVVAGPGSRIALEVSYEGEPKPEVIWFKNGEKVSQSSDGKTIIEESSENDFCRLIIEDLQESDVGSYYVLVENPFGSEKSPNVSVELDNDMVASDDLANTVELGPLSSVTDGPLKRGRAPRILSRPKSVHAPKGSKVAFEVQVSGEPIPIVNWFRDGRLITQTSDGHVKIEEYSNGCVRLVLSDITNSDVGQYHVVAENKLGSERTIPVTLTIDETSGAKSQDFVGEFEEISKVSDEFEKRQRGGRPPRILLRPKSVSTRPGSDVTLEVNVVGHSKDSTITWYKNGKQITTTSDNHIRIEKVTESYQKLVITNVKESDSGDYSVSATNDFGLAMSEPVKMTVNNQVIEETTTTTTTTSTESFYERFVSDGEAGNQVGPDKKRRAPKFTLKPRNKKAPIGSKVEFEVCVKGEPKPDVVWYKNGRRIHLKPDGRVRVEEFSDGGSKLVIDDLEEIDHGVYAAEAKNEWGVARTEDVQLRVTERTEISEKTQLSKRGTAKVTTKTKKTRTHYTFSEERHGYVTLTLNDAQMEHDGDYKLIVRNKWGEASTQAPLVVIPKVEPRSVFSADRSGTGYEDSSVDGGRDSRSRRTPFDELEDYGHELDKSVGIFGSESRYQSGDDTYLLQLRDTEFPLRLRKYLRFGARQSPSLRSNLMDAHWGAGARVTIRERRKFREVMDEEIDDEKRGLDLRPTPMRLQKEIGTCGYAAAQLEHLRVEAAERVQRKSADPEAATSGSTPVESTIDMMPPFFRVKLKDCVIEETMSGQQEAVFFCLAAGQPQPEYTWFRNDNIITDVNRMLIVSRLDGGSELHIRDPRLHDSGCFKCVARNVHGNVTTRARLRVASKPSRPEPPEYVSVTCKEVFLTWRPPRDYDVNAADILGYKLELSQSSIGDQDNWSVIANDIGHEYYVVDNLTPATSYSFRLSARNKFGWSESSYSTYVTTSRDESTTTRLNVPYEMRSRQYTADICDLHLLRHCEDEKLPELNYQIELNPVKLEIQEKWAQNIKFQTEIARGRFSIISKASSVKDSSQQVVVKAILVESMMSAQTKNEFDILRSLQHEKVVRLQVAYKDDELFVFVMERLSGIDVLTYLSSFTSYNEDTVSKIITQVMDAIEYLHFRGMCLLELLPDNVVMTNARSTSLKLVDFSSARFVPRSGARVPINASQNVEYCPPEVIAGHEVSTASDVWCIGVLTYVLLSGFSPFKGESGEDETRENVRLGRYKYDHIYNNCTPEVTRFLINVFKKHSTKRPTIEQLYENKWLLPNEFMIRKRQQAVFKTDKIVAFAEEFHKFKRDHDECPQKLIDLMKSSSSSSS